MKIVKLYAYVTLLMLASPLLTLLVLINMLAESVETGAEKLAGWTEGMLDKRIDKLGDKPRNLETTLVPKIEKLHEEMKKG